MSTALAIPAGRELEALSPADRWDLEDALDNAQDILRDFNDDELRRWVEVEGKTQAEVGELVGRDQTTISYRCRRLGIRPKSNRGRKGNRDVPKSPEGPAHYLPDVVAEDALDNLRTQALHWFEQGALVKGLLDSKRPLEPRSDEDRKAIKRDAALMERTAHRLKEIL